MRKIALVNQKGGCGKTTTAINVASFLAATRKKVLLVDLDPQGHSGLGLGVKPERIENSIYEVLLGEIPINRAILTVRKNLDMLLSDVVLSAFEQVMAGDREREHRLKKSLENVRQRYDYLIIDSPPSVGLLTFNGLIASEEVIIPVDSSYFSIQALDMLLDTLRIIENKGKHQLSVKILATNIDLRTKFGRLVVKTLRTKFPDNCFKTIINTSTALREAVAYGKTIIEYNRQCIAFRDYLSLTKEILKDEPRVRARRLRHIDYGELNLTEMLPEPSNPHRSVWIAVWDLLERQR